jgi:NSS family neurotransmitter:Na+ symporter
MPFGAFAAVAFFVLLFFAALASAISLLEVAAALLIHRFGWSRRQATVMPAAVCFIGGIATVLSFNVWADWHPLGFVPALAQATVFDLIDHLTSNVLLPVGGFALAVLAGWALPGTVLAEELRLPRMRAARLRWILRWVVPAGILVAALTPLFI